MMQLIRRTGFITVTALMVLTTAQRSFANCSTWTAINSCTATCSSDCYLLNDQNCTDGQGITLNSGARLDMCGHTLTCTDASGVCPSKAAITMTANGSQVFNSATTSQAQIINPFQYGVKCDHTSTRVSGIRFENVGTVVATEDCAKVENNVFKDSEGVLLTGATGANTDEIHNNYFDNVGTAIEVNNRTAKITIDHNLFAMGAASVQDVALTNASNVVTNNNVFLGQGAPFDVSSSTVTYSANYCDPVSSNCATCVGNGQCFDPPPPFTMP